MNTVAETIKRILVRCKKKDFKFITENWSVFRSQDFDLSAAGDTKTKLISALLERIKVITVMNCYTYVMCKYVQ